MPGIKPLKKIDIPIIPPDCGFKVFRPPPGFVYVLDLKR